MTKVNGWEDSIEIKLYRLVEQIEAFKSHCTALSDRMEKEGAWKSDLRLLDKDIEALGERISSIKELIGHDTTSLHSRIADVEDRMTWLFRLLFTAMLTAGVGLIVFLVKQTGN